MAIIECIPNVSEGRRPEVVERMAETLRRAPGVRLLDYSSDASHNRSVFTLAGDAAGLTSAILGLFEQAVEAIDLRTHEGEHPRVGAVDVVPFVPIEDVTMADCIALANEIGAAVADRFGVPVYLYEDASSNPLRRNLEDIRRGEFEGLAAKMTLEGWKPDFGPSQPHPTAGASVIGARMPLIAYNINLNTDRLDVAKKIAAAIRHSSGGLRFVKAMGVKIEDRNLAQVSINLTNFERTPIFRVFETVKREAERYGVSILESEIVGRAGELLQLRAAPGDRLLVPVPTDRGVRDGDRIAFTVRPRQVRGLDYYTRTTFEITHGALGAQNSVLGGGRYDGLVAELGGPATPAIGFALGIERILLAMEQTIQGQRSEQEKRAPARG